MDRLHVFAEEKKSSVDSYLSTHGWHLSVLHTNGDLLTISMFFWNCADRFKADGLHPNRRGSRLLTANISHALLTTSNSQNQASLPIPAVPKTDTSQTSSHGTEQNIQIASSKDTGPAQTLTTPGNSPVINHFELSDMDFQPEENQR